MGVFDGCGKSHNEWFEVEADRAQNVVVKWTRWMQDEDPYDDKGYLKPSIAIPELNESEGALEVKSQESRYNLRSKLARRQPLKRNAK